MNQTNAPAIARYLGAEEHAAPLETQIGLCRDALAIILNDAAQTSQIATATNLWHTSQDIGDAVELMNRLAKLLDTAWSRKHDAQETN